MPSFFHAFFWSSHVNNLLVKRRRKRRIKEVQDAREKRIVVWLTEREKKRCKKDMIIHTRGYVRKGGEEDWEESGPDEDWGRERETERGDPNYYSSREPWAARKVSPQKQVLLLSSWSSSWGVLLYSCARDNHDFFRTAHYSCDAASDHHERREKKGSLLQIIITSHIVIMIISMI